MRTPNLQIRGLLFILAATSCWALQASLAKQLFAANLSPQILVHFRLVCSAALFGIILALWRPHLLRLQRKSFLSVAGLGAAFATNYYSYFLAVELLDIAAAVFIQYLAPVLVVSIAVARGQLQLTGRIASIVATVLLGSYFVAGMHDVPFADLVWMGVLAGLLAAISHAAWLLLGETLGKQYHPFTVLFYGLTCGAVLWTIIFTPTPLWSSALTPMEMTTILYVVTFGTLIPFSCMYFGIQYVGASVAAITSTLEPVLAGGIAYIVLGESLSTWQIFGGGLIMAAIIALQLRRPARQL